MVKLSLVLYDDTRKRGQHCTMYYTHLYGEIRKSIILLYIIFGTTMPDFYQYVYIVCFGSAAALRADASRCFLD